MINKKINDKVISLSNHGLTPIKSKKYFWPETLGYKYKMSNLLAALGSSQLEQLNSFIKQRKKGVQSFCTSSSSGNQVDGLPLALHKIGRVFLILKNFSTRRRT